jgi:hypothetical protein
VNSTTGLKVKALLLGVLSIKVCVSSLGNHHFADYRKFESGTLGIFPKSEFFHIKLDENPSDISQDETETLRTYRSWLCKKPTNSGL